MKGHHQQEGESLQSTENVPQSLRYALTDLKTLPNPVTRFAPSPTGHLHLGHVASAIFVWGIAQKIKAKVIVRMEDHDRQRSKSTHESSILAELTALKFIQTDNVADSNIGNHSNDAKAPNHSDYTQPTHFSRDTIYRQSAYQQHFHSALARLFEHSHVYHCSCTRKTIIKSMKSTTFEELIYDGTCRDKNLAASKDQTGLRLQITDSPIKFFDELLGTQTQFPSFQCGDLLIRDKKDNWTYHFANVVDDLEDQVNLIIRGQDLLSSTGRQIYLMASLGAKEPPRYLHHPLIRENNSDVKLSKRTHSESISAMLAKGTSPETIIGRAAFLVGLTPNERPVSAEDVQKFFD